MLVIYVSTSPKVELAASSGLHLDWSRKILDTVNLACNDSVYKDILFITILSHGIDYIVREITIITIIASFSGNFGENL